MASKMFKLLLFLLGFGTVCTSKKHVLCSTLRLELFYEKCDDSYTPVIKMEPCEINKDTRVTLSLTIIPRKDIGRLYARVQVSKDSVTVSDFRYVLCSGYDDEFDFCGALKGETLKLSYQDFRYLKQLIKGLYTIKIHLFVGEKEELLACFIVTVNLKFSLIS
ncbi:lymphocyte antigen 96 [Dendropsophus ebraccatus]|uniref:lymphocyte antigen 96 n=1 Tax=Dendropsophus ebraccatus TaxID=150705 RepID=UPI00383123E9